MPVRFVRHRLRVAVLAAVALALPVGAAVPALAADSTAPGSAQVRVDEPWTWPVRPPHRLERPYVAPVHEYGPGHRGIDILSSGGTEILAPADGIIAFVGRVAGRGVLTIDHGDGLVTTLEPVTSDLAPGDHVSAGQTIATLAIGGHTPAGRLHLGVRRNDVYINPLLLLGGVPRAVLLPCC